MVDNPCELQRPEAKNNMQLHWLSLAGLPLNYTASGSCKSIKYPWLRIPPHHRRVVKKQIPNENHPLPFASCQSAGVALARALLGVVGGGGAFMSMAAAGESLTGNLLLDSGAFLMSNQNQYEVVREYFQLGCECHGFKTGQPSRASASHIYFQHLSTSFNLSGMDEWN